MAEPTQILFTHRELVSALLKQQGISTGRWSLSVEFVLGVGLAGPQHGEAMPTAMASVSRVGIQQSQDINSVTFDAAELNPEPQPAKPAKRARTSKLV